MVSHRAVRRGVVQDNLLEPANGMIHPSGFQALLISKKLPHLQQVVLQSLMQSFTHPSIHSTSRQLLSIGHVAGTVQALETQQFLLPWITDANSKGYRAKGVLNRSVSSNYMALAQKTRFMFPWCLAQGRAQQNCVAWDILEALHSGGPTPFIQSMQSLFIQSLTSGNKTINVTVVGTAHTSPVTFHQLLHTSTVLVANPEFIPHKPFCVGPKSQIKPCAPISILVTGTHLRCYCQL